MLPIDEENDDRDLADPSSEGENDNDVDDIIDDADAEADGDADDGDPNGDAEPVADQDPDIDIVGEDGDDGDEIEDADADGDADDANYDADPDADGGVEVEVDADADADASAEAGEGEDAEAEDGHPGPNSSTHSSGITESQPLVGNSPRQRETRSWQPDPEEQAAAVPDSTSSLRPSVRPEALTASNYDIVPTIAAPHSCSVNAVTSTADARWVFSGGSDGFVRKYNWVDSVNAKSMLTVAQRHPFVDSVTKSGVLMTYWENMDEAMLSPVYSLAAQSEGLWLLSGLASGGIRLQSIRHDEGKEIITLRHHTSAVSSLVLSPDERTLLSGSWDKKICDWDLNTGQIRQQFAAGAGQISSIQLRSESNNPLPIESMNTELPSDTFSSNEKVRGKVDTSHRDDEKDENESNYGFNPASRSPVDSLFGGTDSLFGETEPISFDEVGKFETASETRPEDPMNPSQGDAVDTAASAASTNTNSGKYTEERSTFSGNPNGFDDGPPKSEEEMSRAENNSDPGQPPVSNAIFLSSSIDGTIRVWDRRQPSALARIQSRNAPPWCTNACWSIDGQYIYAGRRNNTVEEFSLHKGLREPVRTFKFPSGSGAVTALQAMPNGKNLICASYDNLRLYNLQADSSRQFAVPFLIVPGHRTGTISQLYLDRTCRFMLSAGGNRGWDGSTTEVLLGYEIGIEK